MTGFDAHDSIAEQVIRTSAMQPRGVYLLGPLPNRISFAAQQRRALNLVYALKRRGLLGSGDPVAVIGAGLSGLTTAVALIGLNCEVQVFEPAGEALSVERASHRLVHPTINFWPTSRPSMTTQMPFLDWAVGNLSVVASDVLAQAMPALEGRIHTNIFVKDIQGFSDGTLGLTAEPPIRDRRFRAVIVTDDLGLDRAMPGIGHISYWLPDDLEVQAESGKTRSFVVSGCGDGGLIDALRLIHRDYNQGRLIQDVAEELYRTELSEIIGAGEAFAKSKGDPKLLDSVYSDAAARLDTDPIHAALRETLRRSSERAPEIILTDRILDAPYALGSAPIHKLLIADALRRGVAWYLKGGVSLTGNDSVMVGDRRVGDLAETRIIVRHGAELSVGHLFSDHELQEYRARSALAPDYDFELFWSDEVAVPPPLPEPVASNPAFLNSRLSMAQRLINARFDAQVAVEMEAFGVVTGEGAPGKIPEQLFGVPVRVRSLEAPAGVTAKASESRIFLSHAVADADKAQEIAQRIKSAGMEVREDKWDAGAAAPAFSQPSFGLTANDVVLVLVSENSLQNSWVQVELGKLSTSKEYRDRKIRVVPVLLEGSEVPTSLRQYQHFDLTQDFDSRLNDLVEQLRMAPLVDLSRLDEAAFERLVADLLDDLGFSLAERDDGICDFDALYEDMDPFGDARINRWAVIVKHQRKHLAIGDIRGMFAALSAIPDISSGLVVSSSRLTSVAREYVSRNNASRGKSLRIVDGADLADLLQERPALIRRHLSPGVAS
jgi:hypothetical protein